MHDLIRRGRRPSSLASADPRCVVRRRRRHGRRDFAAHCRRANPQLVLDGLAVCREPCGQRVSLARQAAFGLSGGAIHRSPARLQGRALHRVLLQPASGSRGFARIRRRAAPGRRRDSAIGRHPARRAVLDAANGLRQFGAGGGGVRHVRIALRNPSQPGSWLAAGSYQLRRSLREFAASGQTPAAASCRAKPAVLAIQAPRRIHGTRRPAIWILPTDAALQSVADPDPNTANTSPDGSAKADAKNTQQLPPGTNPLDSGEKGDSAQPSDANAHFVRRAPIRNPASRTVPKTRRMPRTRTNPAVPARIPASEASCAMHCPICWRK